MLRVHSKEKSVRYTIEQTTLDEFLARSEWMFDGHRDELATNPAIMDVKPDLPAYQTIEQAGQLQVLIAVDTHSDNLVVGYSIGLYTPHSHYSDLLLLENDLLFIHPMCRGEGVGRKIMAEAEDLAVAYGARFVQWHAKPGTPLDKLLQAADYGVQDIIYSREIGA